MKRISKDKLHKNFIRVLQGLGFECSMNGHYVKELFKSGVTRQCDLYALVQFDDHSVTLTMSHSNTDINPFYNVEFAVEPYGDLNEISERNQKEVIKILEDFLQAGEKLASSLGKLKVLTRLYRGNNIYSRG